MIHQGKIPEQSLLFIPTVVGRVARAAVIAVANIGIGGLIRGDVRTPTVTALENTERIVLCAGRRTQADRLVGIGICKCQCQVLTLDQRHNHILGELSDPVFTDEQ